MEAMGTKLLLFVADAQAELNVVLVVVILIIGFKLMATEESREKAKKSIPYIVAGALLVAACINLGAEWGTKLKF